MSHQGTSQQDEAAETRRIGTNSLDEAFYDYEQCFVGDDMGDKESDHLRIISQNTGSLSPQTNLEKLYKHTTELKNMNADVFLFQETGINSRQPRMKNLIKKVIKHKLKRVSIHLNS